MAHNVEERDAESKKHLRWRWWQWVNSPWRLHWHTRRSRWRAQACPQSSCTCGSSPPLPCSKAQTPRQMPTAGRFGRPACFLIPASAAARSLSRVGSSLNAGGREAWPHWICCDVVASWTSWPGAAGRARCEKRRNFGSNAHRCLVWPSDGLAHFMQFSKHAKSSN